MSALEDFKRGFKAGGINHEFLGFFFGIITIAIGFFAAVMLIIVIIDQVFHIYG